ncbi:MAG: PAS domain S-box protein [Syntrophaceae bacterium]|nr:PAS domain S-box protein [Syntrophaceae bacterium]
MVNNIKKTKISKNKSLSADDDISLLAKDIIANAGVGIYIVQKSKFVYVSELYQKITGYSDKDLLGEYSLNYIFPDDREKVRNQAIRCLKRESFEPYEYRFIRKDNELRYILETVTSIMYKGNLATLGSFMDITERKIMEEKYSSILENIQEGYFEVDLAGNFTFFNDSVCRVLGYSREELAGMNNRQYTDQKNAEKVFQAYNQVYKSGIPLKEFGWHITRKDGQKRYIEGSISLLKDSAEKIIGFRGITHDVTERKRAEEALRQSEEKYRNILENIQEAYFEVDLAGNFIFFNDSLCRITGSSREELTGANYKQFSDIENSKNVFQVFNKVFNTGEAKEGFDWLIIRKDGTKRYIEASVSLKKDSKGNPSGFKGIIRDISERKRIEQELNHLATHDALTGLPNRMMFSQLLDHAIQSAHRNKKQLAVLFVDLDRFKVINDSLGHEAGDKLLKEMAQRFKQSLRTVDVVGRLGGDEFIILVEDFNDLKQLGIFAHKILATVIQPFNIMEEECRVTASIGISVFPKDGQDEQSLMKNADIAMYFAKEEGKNNFQFYSESIRSMSNERLTIESNLRHAMERNEFYLDYQAKLDLKTKEITGVEALLRWNNPYLGMVTPTQFIPIAEETGMIVPIGRWVIKTACAQNVAWQKQGLPPVCMSVNLSLRQLMNENFIQDVKNILNETPMSPNLLELELTESMIMNKPERLVPVLMKIKELGVRMAIDDFGTGYSSLARIKNFPINTLKVDRSFIRNIPNDMDNKAITEAVIVMGKSLKLTVVAEGVETKEQEKFLQDQVCDEMQGFYFSKPISPDRFATLLRKNNIAPQRPVNKI